MKVVYRTVLMRCKLFAHSYTLTDMSNGWNIANSTGVMPSYTNCWFLHSNAAAETVEPDWFDELSVNAAAWTTHYAQPPSPPLQHAQHRVAQPWHASSPMYVVWHQHCSNTEPRCLLVFTTNAILQAEQEQQQLLDDVRGGNGEGGSSAAAAAAAAGGSNAAAVAARGGSSPVRRARSVSMEGGAAAAAAAGLGPKRWVGVAGALGMALCCRQWVLQHIIRVKREVS